MIFILTGFGKVCPNIHSNEYIFLYPLGNVCSSIHDFSGKLKTLDFFTIFLGIFRLYTFLFQYLFPFKMFFFCQIKG